MEHAAQSGRRSPQNALAVRRPERLNDARRPAKELNKAGEQARTRVELGRGEPRRV